MAAEAQRRFGYRHSGVAIAADFELPEWSAFRDDAALEQADVSLSIQSSVRCTADALAEAADDRLSFAIEGIGRWSVENGTKIRVTPDPDAAMREIRLFTLGSAWGALGYQRGWAMLHGSAVALKGGAALFCGDTGRGKSTMAAALVERGHPLLADDLSRVDPLAGDAPMLHPSSERIKLWTDALGHLGLSDRELTRDHFRDDKYHLDASSGAPGTAPVPLQAVYVLDRGDDLALERLRGAQATTALFEATAYRPQFLAPMGLLGAQAMLCARIAGGCEVYRLTRPRDLTALDRVCELLESSF